MVGAVSILNAADGLTHGPATALLVDAGATFN